MYRRQSERTVMRRVGGFFFLGTALFGGSGLVDLSKGKVEDALIWGAFAALSFTYSMMSHSLSGPSQ